MKLIINKIKAFVADEKGAEVVEWVLVVGILVVIAVAVYQGLLGGALMDKMQQLIDALQPAPVPPPAP